METFKNVPSESPKNRLLFLRLRRRFQKLCQKNMRKRPPQTIGDARIGDAQKTSPIPLGDVFHSSGYIFRLLLKRINGVVRTPKMKGYAIHVKTRS
ncbi:hypothetical protein MTR_7g056573 [Medicago truncatula]|uniref:Uncharacterized protein n=1 Tax=Medicago truncatula TaxID=3880 RepID=A0A072U0P8_MEDTR|nr:hypothetical protein MTR_7g056573 [Medicago truncatula]